MSNRLFIKDPNAILDYSVDWSAWLISSTTSADTISTSTWIVPSGITQTTNSHTNTVATVWLSGGSADSTYELTNRITTAGGRTDDRTILIKVQNK